MTKPFYSYPFNVNMVMLQLSLLHGSLSKGHVIFLTFLFHVSHCSTLLILRTGSTFIAAMLYTYVHKTHVACRNVYYGGDIRSLSSMCFVPLTFRTTFFSHSQYSKHIQLQYILSMYKFQPFIN